jgi:SNF family Na+-dependent transporter
VSSLKQSFVAAEARAAAEAEAFFDSFLTTPGLLPNNKKRAVVVFFFVFFGRTRLVSKGIKKGVFKLSRLKLDPIVESGGGGCFLIFLCVTHARQFERLFLRE